VQRESFEHATPTEMRSVKVYTHGPNTDIVYLTNSWSIVSRISPMMLM